MKHLLAGLCLALSALPGHLAADAPSFCGKAGAAGWADIRDSLVGEWLIEHQSGYARAGNMIIPFGGDGKVETLTMWIFGDELVATHPEAQAPLVFQLADEGRWTVDTTEPYKPAPVLSPDDVGLIYGCDQLELPRLVGTTTAVAGGTEMQFTYRFMVADPQTLFGVMEVTGNAHGSPFLARRTVWMRPVGS